MATLHDVQIFMEVAKFGNIINDLLDCIAYTARNIAPEDGITPTPLSVEERKAEIQRYINSVNVYYPEFLVYIDNLTLARANVALTEVGIDAAAVRASIVMMKGEADWITTQLPGVTTDAQLITGADRIDANVPKLPLWRRRRAL